MAAELTPSSSTKHGAKRIWAVNPLRGLVGRLSASAEKVASHCVSVVLLLAAAVLAWQLVAGAIYPPKIDDSKLAGMVQVRPAPSSRATAAHVQEAHLFGNSSPSAPAMPTSVVNGNVSVIGIAYSDHVQDSVALLSVGGETVVSHVGSQLPTGERVSRILADGIELSGNGGTLSVLLDIKRADPNERITPGSYAVSSGPSNSDLPTALFPVSGAPVIPAAHVTLAPTHFVSLRSLRGARAAKRFEKLDAPLIPGEHH